MGPLLDKHGGCFETRRRRLGRASGHLSRWQAELTPAGIAVSRLAGRLLRGRGKYSAPGQVCKQLSQQLAELFPASSKRGKLGHAREVKVRCGLALGVRGRQHHEAVGE